MRNLAGVVFAFALCIAWGGIFVPRIWEDRRLARTIVIETCLCVIFYTLVHLLVSWGPLSTFVRVPFSVPVLVALVSLGSHRLLVLLGVVPASNIVFASMLFVVATLWAPIGLHEIAQDMWRGPDPAIVRTTNVLSLAAIHMFMIFVMVFLSILLWLDYRKRCAATVTAMAGATLASTALLEIAIAWTVPRGGGEGVEGWILLIPCALLVGIWVVLTCVFVSVRSFGARS